MKLERKLLPRIEVINRGRSLNEIKSRGLDLLRSVVCYKEGHLLHVSLNIYGESI